jgi:hypothetical protein
MVGHPQGGRRMEGVCLKRKRYRMAMNEKKLKRMDYLGEVIKKYMITEPKLELEDIAEVLAVEISDLTAFLKEYKKALNNNF